MSTIQLSEESLVEYAKPYLKTKGFKKKNKRWTKTAGDFTLVFYIQGSCYSKENYYIRPGVFMNNCPEKEFYFYGHFMTGIKPTTPQQVLEETEFFFKEWTDTELIKHRARDFVEWENRNPLEKRRAGEVDYEKAPPPTQVFFQMRPSEMDYILNCL